MKQITIKNFVKEYNNIVTDNLKERYIKDNIEIKKYIPFVIKKTYAENLAKISMLKFENYTDENGVQKRRATGEVMVDSSSKYLFFCRSIIENYTNLQIESEGFFEEYDMLMQSGLIDIIFGLIPEKEMGEYKMLVDMACEDIMTNYYGVHNYISTQVNRFGQLTGVILKPILEKLEKTISDLDENKIDKISKTLSNSLNLIK